MSTPLQKKESMSIHKLLEQNENVTNFDQDITEKKISKMKLAHTVYDNLRNYFIFLCI